MARAMLMALAFAELACGARYVDYGGVKMPQYGGGADYEGPRDEYEDHSPDILSASHDYRDEDEFIGKTEKLIKDVEETEGWQKFVTTGKYRRQSSTIDDGDIDTLDKYSPEEMVPKFKPNNRFAKHRSFKIRDFERGDVPRRRFTKSPSRHRVEDVRKDVFDELHSDDFRERKHSGIHEDSMEFTRRATTARVIRRKPRDRFEKDQPDDDDPLADLGLSLDDSGVMKSGRLGDYPSDTEFRRDGGPPRRPEGAPSFSDTEFHRSSGLQRRPSDQDETFRNREESMEKPKEKPIQEYNDYYDMKRVQSIKNKLPGLLHLSTDGPEISSSPTVASIAEKELKAALSAHRQRKDAPVTVNNPPVAIDDAQVSTFTASVVFVTLPPGAVERKIESEWSSFIELNGGSPNRQILSNYVVYLVFIITLLQRYKQIIFFVN